MTQRALDLALPPVYSEANFHIAPCNEEAHTWLMRWPDWPSHALWLHGTKGAGKSHLGHIWAARAKAGTISAAEDFAPDGMRGNWLIEDVQHLKNEHALFHLLNLAKENKGSLLLTSDAPASALSIALPDLKSRLLALPVTSITAPDDETLAAVLRKQFSDRQLKVADDAISYLASRMERSFAEAASMVAKLDQMALEEKRELTIPFFKRALDY